MEEIEIEKCSKCREEKPLTTEYFHKDNRNNKGFNTQCKQCVNGRRRDKAKERGYTVYAHINKVNNRIYIGSTCQSVNSRWRKGNAYKNNKLFWKDILKYGWNEGFEHEIIANELTREESERFEILLIKELETQNQDKGYNFQLGGKNSMMGIILPYTKKVICDNIIYKSITECAEHYNIKTSTMRGWLSGERGMPQNFFNLGLCFIGEQDKVKLSEYKKSVFCDNLIFESATNFAKYYNIKSTTAISWLNGNTAVPQEFIDLNLHYIGKEDKIKAQTKSKKKVVCENIIFDSLKQCSNYYNVKYTTMHSWLKNRNPMSQEFKDLGLCYYNED